MSSETKFTPGPWLVPDQTWRRELTVELSGDDRIKCPGSGGAMSYTKTVCTLNWSGTDEWMANAHLIAAAPDMYEALERLCTLNDEHGPFGGEMYQDRIDRAWDKAKSAVSKARGES